MTPKITIRVNGDEYTGWTDFILDDSIKAAAAGFELSTTERWQDNDTFNLGGGSWRLRAGDACSVFIDGERVLNGYIDVHMPSYDRNQHNVAISGRSLTADLVDCSAVHIPGNFKKQSPLQIANALASPFGVDVVLGEYVNGVSWC